MNAIESIRPFPPLHWTEKVLAMIVWGAVGALFFFVGWDILRPADPQGAISLIFGGGFIVKAVSMWALAAIVSGVVTFLMGKRLSDVGLFTVCLGLGFANLRGDSVSYFLTNVCGPDASARSQLALSFLGETALWAIMIVISILASGVAMKIRGGENNNLFLGSMAVSDFPKLGTKAAGTPTRSKESLIEGIITMVKVAAIALVVFRLAVAGASQKVIHHQQVYFAIAVSFWLAFWFVGRYWSKKPIETPFWGILAIIVVAIIGYAWSVAQPGMISSHEGVAHIPPTPYIRALPIEYMTVGPVAVIAAFWHLTRRNHLLDQLEREEQHQAKK